MAKIFIGIAMWKPHKNFLESLSRFLPDISDKHDVELFISGGKPLVESQNIIAEKFLASDKDYLLTLEDDHWGHTPEMLDDLLSCDSMVSAIKYYCRYPFFVCALMEYYKKDTPNRRYKDLGIDIKGHHECDLVPFGMTLIKRQVFDILDKPYFRLNSENINESDKTHYATDRDFCDRLIEKGVRPIGCFDHCLTHAGIHDDNVMDLRISLLTLNKEYRDSMRFGKFKNNPISFKDYWLANKDNVYRELVYV